ncbi:alpha-L-rhamnosidase C-terminal domain-containing protein [Halalkalibacter sp. AB-rgal2]|uniref:alpha-L-rhamnosidase-related protein n=1 Tax=Halalkalibacter sp. AB-rgal2 TaxID=3242695 RepID=UPI00359EF2C1
MEMWNGYWIGHSWMDDTSSERNQYYAFRKQLHINGEVRSSNIHITADSRYVLWVNDQFVSRGPARCYPEHQAYDTVDISPYLKSGTNWMAVLVHQFGVSNYQYVHRLRTGLFVDGAIHFENGEVEPVQSDRSWEVRKADWFEPSSARYTLMMGYQERFNASKEVPDWRCPKEHHERWQEAWYIGPVGTSPWTGMEARGIPQLVEYERKPVLTLQGSVKKDELVTNRKSNLRFVIEENLLSLKKCTTTGMRDGWMTIEPIEAHDQVIAFDYGQLITAYPVIEMECCEGDVIDSYYSINKRFDGLPNMNKGFSTDREGVCDRVIAREGDFRWQSYFPKGYQYHTLIVRARATVKVRVTAQVTHYPVKERGHFHCDDPIINEVWKVSERTLRAGMLDAYVDNSWREQAQWLLDGVTSSLAAHAFYGDADLFRRSLKQWGQMQMPDGSLYSVGPKDFAFMNLTDYNFDWICGLHNYYMLTDDDVFLKEMHPVLLRLLGWAESHMTDERLFLQPEGQQLFIDWSDVQKKPYSLSLNLKLLLALQKSSYLLNQLQDNLSNQYIAKWSLSLREEIEHRFWDAEERLWLERVEPNQEIWSKYIQREQPGGWANSGTLKEIPYFYAQHGNAYSLLAGIGSKGMRSHVAKWVEKSVELDQTFTNHASPMVFDHIISALFEEQKSLTCLQAIKDWFGREIRNGATTWPEQFNAVGATDLDAPACGDCGQTIGSAVGYLLSRYVLGCWPTEPGWRTFRFAPQIGHLTKVQGVVPTLRGDIVVDLHRDVTENHLTATIDIPASMRGEVMQKGECIALMPGKHTLVFP